MKWGLSILALCAFAISSSNSLPRPAATEGARFTASKTVLCTGSRRCNAPLSTAPHPAG